MKPFFRVTFLYAFALTLLFSFSSLYSQNKKEDSLLTVLKNQKDTARISTLLKLAALHFNDSTSNPAVSYLNKAYDVAEPLHNKKFLGLYYNALGTYYQTKGDIKAAQENYKKALTMYKAIASVNDQIKTLYKMAMCYINNNELRQGIPFFEEAVLKAKAANNQDEVANSNYNIGRCYEGLGESKLAIKYYTKSLDIYTARNDSDGISRINSSLGSNYCVMADYTNATDCYIKAKKIYARQGKLKDYAGCIVNMGFVYQMMHNEDKALLNFYEGERILDSIHNKDFLANVRHSIATILIYRNQFSEALVKLNQAKQTFLEMGNQNYYANCLSAIGGIYISKKEYDKARPFVLEALQIKREIEEQEGICLFSIQLGELNTETGKLNEAVNNFTEALNMAKKIGHLSTESTALLNLAELNSKLNNHKLANQYYSRFAVIKDSLVKTESIEKVAEMEALYKTEKQAGEIAILNEQKKAQANQIKVNSMQRNMLLGGVLVLGVIAFLIYNRYRLKQKSNRELQSAYDLIQASRDEIALQKKEIVDSIHYAKRIQKAILPSTDLLKAHFTEHFVLYLPKDVVSGDLYWFAKVKNTVLLAAVDCTGHGVPGAFMSVIGVDNLNNIVNDKELADPSRILTELDQRVVSSLSKSDAGNNIQDGMDMALCAIDLDTNYLHFAGAYRPLIHIRNGVVKEIRPTKASIGGYLSEDKKFDSTGIQLIKGDCIYMFTDGFADQFGGPKGKKFKYKQLQETILAGFEQPMETQKQKLADALTNWRGNLEQVDDVCVIGVRI